MNYGMRFVTLYRRPGIKTIPMEKKCKKVKWLSGKALHIAVKSREAKSKGEKERYKHLNAEFQRIARRDKVFFSDQCKEIEERYRMGEDSTHEHHQMVNTEIRLIVLFAAKDGEALYSQTNKARS